MNRNCIEFIYEKTTRRPRRLENNVFVLYSPERIKLQPGEIKLINMKIKLRLPNNLVGAGTLLPSLSDSNIKIIVQIHFIFQMDEVIASQNQPIDLPYAFALEIQNQNMNRTVQLKKTKNLDSLHH